MIRSAKSRWFGVWGAALLVATASASGCGGGIDEDLEIQRAIVEAAAQPMTEAAAMSQRGLSGAESLAAVENQRLTIALLALETLGPLCREDGAYLAEQGPTPELEYVDAMTDPGILARCYKAPKADRRLAASLAEDFNRRSGDPDATRQPMISAIWPEYITEVESDVDGDSLNGVVSYTAPGCWRGRVPFHGVRSGGRWMITEFDLPLLGWSLTLEDSGVWEATRTLPDASVPSVDRIGVGRNGSSVFSGVTFPNDTVVMVGFGGGGALEIFDDGGFPQHPEQPGEAIDGRPVVLVPSRNDATVGDWLDALTVIRSLDPPVPVIGMYGAARAADPAAPPTAPGEITLLTDASIIPIDEPINRGPRFCISPSAIRVSTGQEMPLAVRHRGETLDFARYEVARRNPDLVFLINPQREAPFSDLEVVLVAIQSAGGMGAVIATERYRGIAVVSGG